MISRRVCTFSTTSVTILATNERPKPRKTFAHNGGMAEWLKAAVLKTVKGESSSRVRIPLPPRAPKTTRKGCFRLCEREGEGFERRSRYTRRAKRGLVGESGSWKISKKFISDRIPLHSILLNALLVHLNFNTLLRTFVRYD